VTAPAANPKSWRSKLAALPANGVVRKKALAIVAMRLAGYDTAEIAEDLRISKRSVRQYLWIAGKHGWLAQGVHGTLADPRDRLEFEIGHKVVRNLDQMLDSSDPAVRHEATLEAAKGTIFKAYDQQALVSAPNTNVLSIRVELPPGAQSGMRADAISGTAAYVEGEVNDAPAPAVHQSELDPTR
jgi:hypothetical protein